MNILDHHQTLHSKGHGTSYIANQREYVEDRYDFNAAYDAYSQQCTNRFINPYNKHQVKHTTNEHVTKKLNGICQPHSLNYTQHCTGKNSNPVISMCSLNVCGFNSKLKYHVLQQYMQLFDFICVLETKCNAIDENELSDYKTFIMPRKSKTQKYGGI